MSLSVPTSLVSTVQGPIGLRSPHSKKVPVFPTVQIQKFPSTRHSSNVPSVLTFPMVPVVQTHSHWESTTTINPCSPSSHGTKVIMQSSLSKSPDRPMSRQFQVIRLTVKCGLAWLKCSSSLEVCRSEPRSIRVQESNSLETQFKSCRA